MKKKSNLNGRLNLKKQTVSRLNDNTMSSIKGGAADKSKRLCVSTSKTKPCETNNKSCFKSCQSWIGCHALLGLDN